jgi:hypothetical protein
VSLWQEKAHFVIKEKGQQSSEIKISKQNNLLDSDQSPNETTVENTTDVMLDPTLHMQEEIELPLQQEPLPMNETEIQNSGGVIE